MAARVAYAQPDTARITSNALHYADSLERADSLGLWSSYADLTPIKVLKYYGGKDGFTQHVALGRTKTASEQQEPGPEFKVINLENRDQQWQCQIRLSRYFHKEGVQYHFITYLIGQSLDDGETWKLFDVSYNSIANIIYMFPDIMDDFAITDPKILSQEQENKIAHNK